MRKIILLIAYLLSIGDMTYTSAQTTSSQNGYNITTKGEYRIFVVFSELINDPKGEQGALGSWQVGQMPFGADDWMKYISQYFKEASFDSLKIVADYYPKLVQVDYNEALKGNVGCPAILTQLSKAMGDSTYLITKGGRKFPQDFDLWTQNNSVPGRKVLNTSNGKVDFIAFIFRTNRLLDPSRFGGSTSYSGISYSGISAESYTKFLSPSPQELLRHEFMHLMLGGNDFHNGIAGAGYSTYIHNYSGYGMLSSGNCSNHGCNAWDRRRLGWKYPGKAFYISAINPDNQREISTDFVYGDSSLVSGNEFIIRDFTTYGDVLRIKLPYLPERVNSQWIWLENHQPKEGTIEYKTYYYDDLHKFIPKGMYVNLQVGSESLTSFTSRTNYYTPIISLGNYDIQKYNVATASNGSTIKNAITSDSLANPFTGYDFASSHATDLNADGHIPNNELVLPCGIYIDNKEVAESDCHYLQYTLMGSKYDAFRPNEKLSISTNPAPVTRLTYYTYNSPNKVETYYANPSSADNRKIYLNGLSIEMLEQYANGDIRVRIRYNDFCVNKDVRWCGDIVLNDSVCLASRFSITLDQGLSATRPVNPINFKGKSLFSDNTKFTCNPRSVLELNEFSKLHIKNKSSLIANNGSIINVKDANLIVDSACTLNISGGTINVTGKGVVYIKKNANFIKGASAHINLVDSLSCILIEGSNAQYPFSGNGAIYYLEDSVFLQNDSVTSTKRIFANKVYAGSEVTLAKQTGNYTLKNGSKVIMQSKQPAILQKGFEAEKGCFLEIKSFK